MNVFRTALLMAAMTALFLTIGFLIGGAGGVMIAFMIAVAMNFYAYWQSDKLVLRMHNAREASASNAPDLARMTQKLAIQADLPMPAVYIIDSAQPNAFATGRNPENAAVAVTTGLMHVLNREEVEGVVAHELAHIKNRDTLTMTITATLAGAISMLANFAFFFGGNRNNPLGLVGTILVMILAPIAAMLVQMAISRTREFAADRTGAEICGNPLALANALRKLERGSRSVINQVAENNPASAHLYIANPLRRRALDSLFSTHPNMNTRIQKLEGMAASLGSSANALKDKYRRPMSDYDRPSISPTAQSTVPSTNRDKRQKKAQTGTSGIPETSRNPQNKSPWG